MGWVVSLCSPVQWDKQSCGGHGGGGAGITSRITSKFMDFIKNGRLLMEHDAEKLVPAFVLPMWTIVIHY